MRIIAVFVETANGKITKGAEGIVQTWASSEDQAHFSKLIQGNNLIVMGSGTYEAHKSSIKLEEGKLRVVVTSKAEKYKNAAVAGQLEFTSETPIALVKRLEEQGFHKMLLVGGADLFTSFLEAHLVNELYLTIEPKLFGQGKNLLADVDVEANLELLEVKKLNEQGTLLLHYKIV